jgi:heat shock protein HslJ
MKSLKYPTLMLCFLSLASCSIFKKSSTSQTDNNMKSNVITDRKWKLVELAGKPVADKINGKEPFILLQKSDNRYSASGGCNGLGGTFTLLEHGRIKFSQGMSTMMACEHMEIENGLNKALVTADNYSLSGDNLSLNKARMAPLARFKAVK